MTRGAYIWSESYNAYCPDCATGAGPLDEDAAEQWASEHNAENHTEAPK